MKWLVPSAFMAVLGVTIAHSLVWGALICPLFIFAWVRHRPSMKIIAFCFGVCAIFIAITSVALSGNESHLTGEEQRLPLRLAQPFKIKRQTATTTATTVKGESILVKVYLQDEHIPQLIASNSPAWCYWNGELERPSPARNPHSFNYRTYLWNQNTHWIFTLSNADDFTQCQPIQLTIREKLDQIRQQGMNHLKVIFPEKLQPIAKSLLFGDRSDIEGELLESYQQLGVIHLLAISGMHVGMIVSLLWWCLLRIGLTKEKVRIVILVLMPLYAIMTGASPPVVRAVSVVMAVIACTMIAKRLTLIQALCLSVIVQLMIDPILLLHVGFQLSYAVSLSLVLSAARILSAKSWFESVFIVTVVAQLGALPILLWHFHEVSFMAFVTNLLYIPIFTLFLLPSLFLLYLFSFFLPDVTFLLAGMLEKGVLLLDSLSVFLSTFPFATVVFGKPSYVLLFFYIIALFYMFSRWENRAPFKAIIFLLIVLCFDWFSSRFNPFGTVLFIDVGQGDSILIDLPWGNGTYLIDTGGAVQFGPEENQFSVGKEIVWPVLKARGITAVDAVILTHGDWDHIGGTLDLIDYIEIGEVWISPSSYKKETMEEVVMNLQNEFIPVQEKISPFSWTAGNAYFELLYPQDNDYEGNDDSLVIWAKFGGLTWLFTGDVEEKGEQELLSRYSLKSDVLKVGHHGSHTSTSQEFLTNVSPTYAIISAGVNNRYNHPHPEVTQRITEQGAVMLGTYLHGAIEYRFRGDKGTFQWMIP